MPQEPQEIEVEVVDAGGPSILVRDKPAGGVPQRDPSGRDWRQWHGRVRTLDSRWWPLWVLLGILAVALALTIGVVVGILYLILRAIRAVISAILR